MFFSCFLICSSTEYFWQFWHVATVLFNTSVSQKRDFFHDVLVEVAWPDHFLTTRLTSTFFEILVQTDGSYFSHSHPEIWVFTPKLGICEEIITTVSNEQSVLTTLNKTINNILFSYYFKPRYKSVVFHFGWAT